MALLWKIPTTVGIVIVGIIAMLLIWSTTFDRLLGLVWYGTDTQVGIVKNNKSNEVIIVGVGFQNSAQKVGATLAPKLREVMNVALVQYPQRGFDPDEIYRTIIATVRQHGFKHISLYGGSMGALFQAYFMKQYRADGMPFGKIRVVIMDDPVTSWRSVKMPKAVLKFFSRLPGGPVLTWVKAPFVRMNVSSAINAAEPGSDLAALKSHYWAMGLWPMPSTAAELSFMLETDVSTMNLANIAERVVVVSGGDEDGDDPLIKLSVSLAELKHALGTQQCELVIDPARQKGEHNTAAERPTFIAETLRTQLALAG